MQFYRIEGLILDENLITKINNRRENRNVARLINVKSDNFNQKVKADIFCFVTELMEDTAVIGMISNERSLCNRWIDAYLGSINLKLDDIFIEEITLKRADNMLCSADGNSFINDDWDILDRYELSKLREGLGRSVDYEEKVLDIAPKSKIYREAERYLTKRTLIPELDRIYAGKKNRSASGHPVHYFLQSDEEASLKNMSRLLLQALYSNERLCGRRCCYIEIRHNERFSSQIYECLYKSNTGGAVVIKFMAGDDLEDDHASTDREAIERMCDIAKKYRSSVLTIFCLARECTAIKEIFYENLDNMTFVEIKEDFVGREESLEYLKMLASEHKIRSDKKLFEDIEENEEYLASDLTVKFDNWYNEKLKTSVYPQYRSIACARKEVIKKNPSGPAYEKLEKLTGLGNAKKVMKQALDYYKAQKVFAGKGMKSENVSMHMVFTGNPGTAKTTTARIFAKIMKENGLLSKGNLIEVGRGDLIGKYVGWTAQIIQKKFKEAMGNILFIDEAYSLVDDRSGSFGDEAINTIVQEMENHRNDVVVIFAGYPDKMEEFLNRNPGLRSRIAFHVPFEDYSVDELCSIADMIAEEKGMVISSDAYLSLREIFERVKQKEDYGNGRFVRNLIEQARMAKSSRLLDMDYDKVKRSDVVTLTAEDIEASQCEEAAVDKRAEFKMGFSA